MFLSILISVSFFPILKILSIIVYFDKLPDRGNSNWNFFFSNIRVEAIKFRQSDFEISARGGKLLSRPSARNEESFTRGSEHGKKKRILSRAATSRN